MVTLAFNELIPIYFPYTFFPYAFFDLFLYIFHKLVRKKYSCKKIPLPVGGITANAVPKIL